MKREDVLFYISNNKIHIYLNNAKKEFMEKVDTSSFFKFGEIYDVEKFRDCLNTLINKKNILVSPLRPNLYVLYNDITNCDLRYLYKKSLEGFNYSDIKFICLSDLVHNINKSDKIVLFDMVFYTVFKYKYKVDNLNNIDFKPIIIGRCSKNNVYYADKDLIWNEFKTHFTNL